MKDDKVSKIDRRHAGNIIKLPRGFGRGFGKIDIHVENVTVNVFMGDTTRTKSPIYEKCEAKGYSAHFVMSADKIKDGGNIRALKADPVFKDVKILPGVDIEGYSTGNNKYSLIMVLRR